MEACPKCNFELAPGAAECPACGVILAKLKAATGVHRPLHAVPPLPSVASNPYAPPAAQIEGPPSVPPPPLAAVPAQDVITRPTLEALETLRPWLRFLVVYGFVMLTIMLLAALGLLVFGMGKAETVPLAIFYFLYGVVGFSLLLPLHRSSAALGRIPYLGASSCLETFATEQSSFWRRSGLICVVMLVLIGAGLVFGVLAGVFAAAGR